MPPKGSSALLAELGNVVPYKDGYRARAKNLSRETIGPRHAKKAEADEDLRQTRSTNTYDAYAAVPSQPQSLAGHSEAA